MPADPNRKVKELAEAVVRLAKCIEEFAEVVANASTLDDVSDAAQNLSAEAGRARREANYLT